MAPGIYVEGLGEVAVKQQQSGGSWDPMGIGIVSAKRNGA